MLKQAHEQAHNSSPTRTPKTAWLFSTVPKNQLGPREIDIYQLWFSPLKGTWDLFFILRPGDKLFIQRTLYQ
jgi:hypothetical protein